MNDSLQLGRQTCRRRSLFELSGRSQATPGRGGVGKGGNASRSDLSQGDGSRNPERESLNGVEITRIPLKRWRGGKLAYIAQYGSFVLLSGAILAVRACRRRYDLVHVHNMPDFLVFSALVPKMLGARVILDQHDPMPELMMTIFGLRAESLSVRLLKVIEKWSLGFADAVLTVNQACKKIFSARSCPASKVSVIMNAPDAEIFQYRPAASGNTRRTGWFEAICHYVSRFTSRATRLGSGGNRPREDQEVRSERRT